MDKRKLRQLIIQYFNEEEIRLLCFDLNISYDVLPGREISVKVMELIQHTERHNRLYDLLRILEEERPNVDWPLTESSMKLEWVEIPAGKFWLGSEKGHDDEKPVQQVYLDTYQIGKTPVTNAQYQFFVAAAGQAAPSHWQNGSVPKELVNHPVVNVNWHEALAYCRWLSEVTGKPITLPSEAEWEKAARGDKDKREYPWGDTFDPKRANTYESGPGETLVVGSYPQGASPYGVLDMSGNVWEWTRNLFKDYPYQADDGRENLEDISSSRVLRGGSWALSSHYARAAYRVNNHPDFRYNDYGFRVVVRRSPSHRPLITVPAGER